LTENALTSLVLSSKLLQTNVISFRREYITHPFIPAALVPGQVQNLRSTLDPDIPTLTLHWDKPTNMNTDGDVKSYDIRFKPCGREGNYCKETVVSPATNIILTRESGLKPMTKYKFEVRARSTSQEGKWSELSEYIGMFILILCIFVVLILY